MDPTFTVPPFLDGMAAFTLPNGNVRLIRNHEVRDPAWLAVPIGGNAYDERAGGGTTSLEIHIAPGRPRSKVKLLAEYVSLSGTVWNCAGGPTPWGTWLSCEETTEGPRQGRLKKHGYVFEVGVAARAPADPEPLKAMGRFVHEAVAVDPTTGFVYETEDAPYNPHNPRREPGAGFYRFVPHDSRTLKAGGRLQMLRVAGRPRYDTTVGQLQGESHAVDWVDIAEPDPTAASDDPARVFRQGLEQGGAVFQRLEGCWYGDGSVFFNATCGGDAEAGQVWQYRPFSSREAQLQGSAGQLVLVFESPSRSVLNGPDNICFSPRGGLALCEDSSGVHYIRGLTLDGAIFDLVRAEPALTEFCGATFSPEGDVFFFNVQGSYSSPGATYALWGPWEDGAL